MEHRLFPMLIDVLVPRSELPADETHPGEWVRARMPSSTSAHHLVDGTVRIRLLVEASDLPGRDLDMVQRLYTIMMTTTTGSVLRARTIGITDADDTDEDRVATAADCVMYTVVALCAEICRKSVTARLREQLAVAVAAAAAGQ